MVSQCLEPELLRNLLLEAELHRVVKALKNCPTIEPFLILKGIPFARQVRSHLPARHILDIDLLVSPAAAEATAELLLTLGYAAPAGSPIAPGDPLSWQSSFVRWHQGLRLEVDLHWQLFNPLFFAPVDLKNIPKATYHHDDLSIPVLNTNWTLVHLACHFLQHQATEPRILDDFLLAYQLWRPTLHQLRNIAKQTGTAEALELTLAHAEARGNVFPRGTARPALRTQLFLKRYRPDTEPCLRARRFNLARYLASHALASPQRILPGLWRVAAPTLVQLSHATHSRPNVRLYKLYPKRAIRGLRRLIGD